MSDTDVQPQDDTAAAADLAAGFLSTEHAAKFCDCSQDKIERWIRAGILPAYDIGEGRTQLRVAKADVIAFMRRRRVPAGLDRAEAREVRSRTKRQGPRYQGRYLGKSHQQQEGGR